MKKAKLIGIIAGSLAIAGTLVTTTTVLTSCGSSNYKPDRSTSIIQIIPDEETFNKMTESFENTIKKLNENNKPGWWVKGRFTAIGNKITIIQQEKRGDGQPVLNFISEYFFDSTNKVKVKFTRGANGEDVTESIWDIEAARRRIYDDLNYMQ